MSSGESSDTSMPVLKERDPHNYRKVGYSMIAISISLVAIGIVVWAIGDNYHFSSGIMAMQEVTALTPKAGYNVVLFDVSQPVGSKLELLDHVNSHDAAESLRKQHSQTKSGSSIQILVFDTSTEDNLNSMSNAEVFLKTPKTGYNVILDNYPLSVGQKLTMGNHEESYVNATKYAKQQEDLIKGQEIKVLIFTPSFTDNLKMVTGSSTPVPDYASLPGNQQKALD